MEIGGQSFTSKKEEVNNPAGYQHSYGYWWNEAAIDAFTDNDIDSVDGVVVASQAWTFGVFDGVDQVTPVVSSSGFESSANVINIPTTSTADDIDIVIASRSSGNRDIVSSGTDTTEIIQHNTGFTGYVGQVAGGSGSIQITGDGLAADWTWTLLTIKAPTAASKAARVQNEGLLR
jgi:hypothetical protein